jgi:hypothetical protein
VVAKPVPAIVAPLVDNDGRFANADRAKAIKSVADQGLPADRRHRFTDAIAVSPQACPMTRGDNASA